MQKILIGLTVILLLLLSGCRDETDTSSGLSVHLPQEPRGSVTSSASNELSSQDEKVVCYYANEKTKKYHRSECNYAKRINEENLRITENREELEDEGFEPCSKCQP